MVSPKGWRHEWAKLFNECIRWWTFNSDTICEQRNSEEVRVTPLPSKTLNQSDVNTTKMVLQQTNQRLIIERQAQETMVYRKRMTVSIASWRWRTVPKLNMEIKTQNLDSFTLKAFETERCPAAQSWIWIHKFSPTEVGFWSRSL